MIRAQAARDSRLLTETVEDVEHATPPEEQP